VAGKSGTFYAFVFDSNEPGGSKNNISIDNVRIYTSSGDNTSTAGNDASKINSLGSLRWAMNNASVDKNNKLINLDGPNAQASIATYINLDSTQENVLSNSNGGSGKGDMILFVPTSAFSQAQKSDFLWFYNLNGRQVDADGTVSAAQAGFEEWKYLSGVSVPDGGATAILLGLGALGLAVSRKRA